MYKGSRREVAPDQQRVANGIRARVNIRNEADTLHFRLVAGRCNRGLHHIRTGRKSGFDFIEVDRMPANLHPAAHAPEKMQIAALVDASEVAAS